jgi:hypothetical protein
MNDMAPVIVPKSDQWNADDFIAGPRTFTIKEVRINAGTEQPVSIVLEGTNKFYRPCKSMSRVLVHAWGADASKYVGRSLTLYQDPTVKWAGIEVGGIRISHLSHIAGEKQMVLTATKGSRKPYTVRPLTNAPAASTATGDAAETWANAFIAKLPTLPDLAAVQAFEAEKLTRLGELASKRADLHTKVTEAIAARKAELQPRDQGGFDDDLTAGTPETPAADQPTVDADVQVDRVKAELAAATTSEEVERIIRENERHMTFLPDNLQIALEIAQDNARNRVKQPAGAEA